MANHALTQIRSAAVTALTGLTTSGARVYAERIYELAAANLPGLRVYVDDESSTTETIHSPAIKQRTAQLVVECCAKAASGLDTTCDTMQKEVEIALASGLSISGNAIPVDYRESRFTVEPGATPVGVRRLVFDIEFFTLANAPDSFI